MVAVVVVNKSCIDLFVDWQPDLSRPDLSYDRCVGLVDLLWWLLLQQPQETGEQRGGRPVETTNVAHAERWVSQDG